MQKEEVILIKRYIVAQNVEIYQILQYGNITEKNSMLLNGQKD